MRKHWKTARQLETHIIGRNKVILALIHSFFIFNYIEFWHNRYFVYLIYSISINKYFVHLSFVFGLSCRNSCWVYGAEIYDPTHKNIQLDKPFFSNGNLKSKRVREMENCVLYTQKYVRSNKANGYKLQKRVLTHAWYEGS